VELGAHENTIKVDRHVVTSYRTPINRTFSELHQKTNYPDISLSRSYHWYRTHYSPTTNIDVTKISPITLPPLTEISSDLNTMKGRVIQSQHLYLLSDGLDFDLPRMTAVPKGNDQVAETSFTDQRQ